MKKGPVPREVILQRQERVKELHVFRRLTIPQIKQHFASKYSEIWSERTIWRDINKLRTRFQKFVDDRSVQDYIRQRIVGHEKILGEQWALLSKVVSPMDKSILLQRIHIQETRFVEDLQNLGIIMKPDQKIDIKITEAMEEGFTKMEDKVEYFKNIALKQAEIGEKDVRIKKLEAQKRNEDAATIKQKD